MRHAATGRVRLERRGAGYAALGPDFLVWDDDARSLVSTVCELLGASALASQLPPSPPRAHLAPDPERCS